MESKRRMDLHAVSTAVRWIAIVLFFIMIVFIFQSNLPYLIDKLDSLGIFAPVLFVSLYCLSSLLCLPTVLVVLAGGALFGPVFGTLLNILGATLGAASGFCISRYLKTDRIGFSRYQRAEQLIRKVEHQGWKSVAILRLTPLIPANLVNYGLGLTEIKFSHYLITTIIFLIPNKIMVSYCGYYGVAFLTH